MTYVGIDLHKQKSQICVVTNRGEIVREVRIASRKDAFMKEVESWPRDAKVVLESSTSSEWVARLLETQGVEVVVADPNYAPMMGSRRKRKIKTDKLDARALAEASRLGAYRAANRMSDEDRRVRGQLAARAQLVGTRTSLITLVRSHVLQYGEPLETCSTENFVDMVKTQSLHKDLNEIIAPTLAVIDLLSKKLALIEKKLAKTAATQPTSKRLMTVPGVGPLTALLFSAVIGRPERFQSAGHASAYIGLVPGENSSGDGVRRTRITKTGNTYLRCLLVQCAWSLMRSKEGGELKQWALRLGQKRTKKVAAIALARRLARILWALMKDETEFDPSLNKERQLEVLLVAAAA